MSSARLIDLVILGVLLLVAVRVVPAAWNILRIYFGIRTRRLEDASSFAPPPPPAVSSVADRLSTLGFRRIGERSTVLPGDERRFEWNLVDDTTTVFVSLVPAATLRGGALMACYSAFSDGSFVVTSYPSGATVTRHDFDAAPGGGTPEETVMLHRRRVATFAADHGAPLANRSMADLLERDDTYRRRHGGATLRTRVYRFVALTAVVVIATGAELLRVVVLDR